MSRLERQIYRLSFDCGGTKRFPSEEDTGEPGISLVCDGGIKGGAEQVSILEGVCHVTT